MKAESKFDAKVIQRFAVYYNFSYEAAGIPRRSIIPNTGALTRMAHLIVSTLSRNSRVKTSSETMRF